MRLFRDSPSTSWGFRLHGGMDLNRPLTVQKTILGSPADGELCTGDVILEIQDCDATTMTHQKVQELIKNSGGSLLLRVRRFVGCPAPHTAPTAQIETGILPGQSPTCFECVMMYRVQDTLANLSAVSSSSPPSLLYDHLPTEESIYRLHQASDDRFYHRSPPATTLACRGGKPQSFHDSLYSTLPRLKDLSQPPTGLEEPGWAPARPRTYRPSSQGRHNPSVLTPDRPGRDGSLRSYYSSSSSSVDPPARPMDSCVQFLRPTKEKVETQTPVEFLAETVRLPPDGGGWGPAGDASGPAAARRLPRFNNPTAMGLQSGPSTNETLFGQSKSEVYSLVRQFERNRTASKMDRKEFDMFTDF